MTATENRDVIEIYTDGACKGNPGTGGWGALLKHAGRTRELFGGEAHTTNNRMELTAVIRALEALKRRCRVRLHTDSQYVQQGISEWIHAWKKRGWKTADKKPVKNEDLWRRLDELAQQHRLSPAPSEVGDGRPFINEPLRDFSDTPQRRQFAESIARAVVSLVKNDTTVEQSAAALRAAHDFFPVWRDTDIRRRAAVLVEAAAIMRARRDDLAGIIIRESSKPWREADADVCEAIDFCEYYARCAVDLMQPKRLGRYIGELNESWYQPRGVAVVISPWNFPLAICCGMTVAALVTGNTVVLKPAEQTPGIASIMSDILWEAGVPRGALHLLPGPGETTGAALVRDPRIALIAFTGSKAVGLDILRAAAETPEGQHHVKKVVCEMGGKNAVIIDESADLDEAVLGVRHSAFGFQGQKCSAASRCIVLDSAHDHFVERLVESTKALVIGDPALPGTDIGPVIDSESKAKILRFIARGRAQSTVALAMEPPAGLEQRTGRVFVGPHIFTGVRPEHDIAREEIFGPVLAVLRAGSFDEALAMANGSPYKLTGGVFSRKPSNLERAKREFRVGNLYLNRGITGAIVGRHPFGGFGMSGVGSKAGGSEYLLQFVEPRASAENTMRRGFAPESFTTLLQSWNSRSSSALITVAPRSASIIVQ